MSGQNLSPKRAKCLAQKVRVSSDSRPRACPGQAKCAERDLVGTTSEPTPSPTRQRLSASTTMKPTKGDFNMTDKRVVMTTAGSVDEARRIAEALIARRLAACVNIVPRVVSIYRWKGKTEEAEEWLLWIKTAAV